MTLSSTPNCASIVELAVELRHRSQYFGNRNSGSGRIRFFRAAHRGLGVEIEFTVFKIGHFRQSTTECVQSDNPGIHLTNTNGKGIQGVFRFLARLLNFAFLRDQLLRQRCNL